MKNLQIFNFASMIGTLTRVKYLISQSCYFTKSIIYYLSDRFFLKKRNLIFLQSYFISYCSSADFEGTRAVYRWMYPGRSFIRNLVGHFPYAEKESSHPRREMESIHRYQNSTDENGYFIVSPSISYLEEKEKKRRDGVFLDQAA